eukprot:TRINITY_DN14691_c0_g1_i1.p1 TRINITY_DN14691_c0_g1~~TRINITY_DN14691_c0_g1_i1.p1  ORF type:complete len:899 (+),score=113.89 TRINITY_DN14691_c0_g1_i1:147-2843(+)
MVRPPEVEAAILTKYETVLQMSSPSWEYDGTLNYTFSGLDAFSVLEAGIRARGAKNVQVLDVGCGGGEFLKQLHTQFPELGGFVGLTGDTYGGLAAASDSHCSYPWIAFDPAYFDSFPEAYKDRYKKLYEQSLADISRGARKPGSVKHCFIYGVPVEQLGFFVDPEAFFQGTKFDFVLVSWTFVHLVDPVGMLSTLYKLLKPASGVLLGNTFVPMFERSNSLVPLLEWMWVVRSKGLQLCLEEESVFVAHNGKPDCAMASIRYGSVVEKVWRTILQQQQHLVLSYDVVSGPEISAARRLMQEGSSVANVIVERFPALGAGGRLHVSKWNGSVPLAVQQISRMRIEDAVGVSSSSNTSWQRSIDSLCWVASEAGEAAHETRSFLSMQDIVQVIAEAGKRTLSVLDLSEGNGKVSVMEVEALVGGGMNSNAVSFAANLDQLGSPPPEWFEGRNFEAFDVVLCWNPTVFSEQICDPLGVLCRLYNDFLAPSGTLLIGGLSADILSEEGISDDLLWLFAWAEYLREFSFRLSLRADNETCKGWWIQRKPPFQPVDASRAPHDHELLSWPNIAIGPLLTYYGVTARSRVAYKVTRRSTTSSFNYDLAQIRDAVIDNVCSQFNGRLCANRQLVVSLVLPSTRSRSFDDIEDRLALSQVASWDGNGETQTDISEELRATFSAAEGVKGVFEKVDANKDGRVSKGELMTILRLVDRNAFSDEMLAMIFEEVDLDKDGCLKLVEFVGWCHRTGLISDEEKLAAMADADRLQETPAAAAKGRPRSSPKPKPRVGCRPSSPVAAGRRGRSSGSPSLRGRNSQASAERAQSRPHADSPLPLPRAPKLTSKDLWLMLRDAEGLNYPKAALAIWKAQHVYYPTGEAWKEWLRKSFSSDAEWNQYTRSSVFAV